MDNHVIGFLLVTTVTYIVIQMLIGKVTKSSRHRRK